MKKLIIKHWKQEKYTILAEACNKLWLKGEQSGNVQILKELYIDCDLDTILVKVEQIGKAACHTGFESCFYSKFDKSKNDYITIGERIFDPEKVYKK